MPLDTIRMTESSTEQVVLENRLRTAIKQINPQFPQDAIDDAVRQITRPHSPNLIENNRTFHRMLTEGVDVSYMGDGREIHDQAWLIDLDNIANNNWLVVNQVTIAGDRGGIKRSLEGYL
ncbi:MAG: type restriction enzyme subunit [Acidobacteriota bacterium]|nr:type restriction enzyme subunit [Acidobacteriota bacterium]